MEEIGKKAEETEANKQETQDDGNEKKATPEGGMAAQNKQYCQMVLLAFISICLVLWPISILYFNYAQLEILKLIFDQKALSFLFGWNIVLAALLIFLACEMCYCGGEVASCCCPEILSVDKEFSTNQQQTELIIAESRFFEKDNRKWNCLKSRKCFKVVKYLRVFLDTCRRVICSVIEKQNFQRRIFALALILGSIFVNTVLLIATLAYRSAITDYLDKVMFSSYATSNNTNISNLDFSASIDSAIDTSTEFYIINIVLHCLAASFLFYSIYMSTKEEKNRKAFHSMARVAVFYMFGDGWFLIMTAYFVGERDGSQHIMRDPIIGFFIGLFLLFLISGSYERGKIQERCLCRRLTCYDCCGILLLVALVANLAFHGPILITSTLAVALIHHLYRFIIWITFYIIRFTSEDLPQDDINQAVGKVSMLVYSVLLFAVAMHIFRYKNYLYITLMMIFLGLSINVLGSIIYLKIESRDVLESNMKARQVGIYCMRCAAFAIFINFGNLGFFFAFTEHTRTSIVHMSDEDYYRKISETNWKGRAKEDFIDALESDLWFYCYYSLASLILMTYVWAVLYLWRRQFNSYEELDSN